MKNQNDIFNTLIKNAHPESLQDIWEALDIFDWTAKETPLLTPQDITSILNRYLSGGLSAQQVEDWANLIEASDVALGSIGNEALMDAINELANPVLEGSLTPESATALIEKLNK